MGGADHARVTCDDSFSASFLLEKNEMRLLFLLQPEWLLLSLECWLDCDMEVPGETVEVTGSFKVVERDAAALSAPLPIDCDVSSCIPPPPPPPPASILSLSSWVVINEVGNAESSIVA